MGWITEFAMPHEHHLLTCNITSVEYKTTDTVRSALPEKSLPHMPLRTEVTLVGLYKADARLILVGLNSAERHDGALKFHSVELRAPGGPERRLERNPR